MDKPTFEEVVHELPGFLHTRPIKEEAKVFIFNQVINLYHNMFDNIEKWEKNELITFTVNYIDFMIKKMDGTMVACDLCQTTEHFDFSGMIQMGQKICFYTICSDCYSKDGPNRIAKMTKWMIAHPEGEVLNEKH